MENTRFVEIGWSYKNKNAEWNRTNSFHINSTEGSHPVNKVCEAVDCSEEATKQVEISAGKHGFITLFVCNKCISKFLE